MCLGMLATNLQEHKNSGNNQGRMWQYWQYALKLQRLQVTSLGALQIASE